MDTFLLEIIVTILVLGFCWWLSTLFPLPPPWPLILQVLFGLIALVFVLRILFALLGHGRFLFY